MKLLTKKVIEKLKFRKPRSYGYVNPGNVLRKIRDGKAVYMLVGDCNTSGGLCGCCSVTAFKNDYEVATNLAEVLAEVHRKPDRRK